MPKTIVTSYILEDNDRIVSETDERYVLRFRDIPDDQKPREKLLANGIKNLNAAELLSIVLGVGTQKEDVLAMAQRIVKEYGEKAIINEEDPHKLMEALDIPLIKACQVVASFELGRRYFAKQGGRPVFVRNSRQAYEYVKDMGHLRKEQLRGLYLNSRYQLIHDEVISVGSLTANIVHPREVFQPAIERGAIAIILAHNHPSGRLTPTLADSSITEQLISAGKLLGIDIIDHLVVTSTTFRSII